MFDSIRVEQIYQPNEKQEQPDCAIRLDFTFPVKTADQKVLKKMQEQFVRSFFGENYETLSPKEAAEKFTADYILMYKELKKDYEKELGKEASAELSFKEKIDNTIDYNQEGLICYTVHTERYRGGAHGSSEKMHYVVNCRTGEQVQEDDIFMNEYQKDLSEILIEHIMKINQVENAADLENIGFFSVEEIAPNNNFLIGEEGITYTFNEYEIAAYAVGNIQVFIPYDEIRHLIKQEGILAQDADK